MAGNLVNPGSVWQTSDGKGGPPVYGGTPTITYQGVGAPVVTPNNIPSNAGVSQGTASNPNLFTYATPDAMFTQRSDGSISSNYSLNPNSIKQDVIYPNGTTGTIVKKGGLKSGAIANNNAVDSNSISESIIGAAKRAGIELKDMKPPVQQPTSQQQLSNLKPGAKIPDPAMLKFLKKDQIRYGSDGSIYLGSQQMEVNAIKDYSKTFGKPSTPEQWKQFHDYAYAGKIPKELPGANSRNEDSKNPPGDDRVIDENGMVDFNKFWDLMSSELDSINKQLQQDQNNLIEYQGATAQGTQNIGDQLGEVAPLLQGEQLSYQQQRAIKENTLTRKLGIDEQAKANLIEKGQLQMQLMSMAQQQSQFNYQKARDLRQDQQEGLATMLSLAQQNGIGKNNWTPAMLSWLNTGAKALGISPDFIIKSLDSIYNQALADNLYKNKALSDSQLTTGYKDYLLAGGQVGTGMDYGSWLMQSDSTPIKTTQTERDAAGYAKRVQEASDIISIYESVGKNLWGIVSGNQRFPNFMKSKERQELEQAERNFVNAVLRRESGAVISEQEFDNASKQYFPQPGDSDDVLRQKKQNRETTLKNLQYSAGNAYSGNDGDYNW